MPSIDLAIDRLELDLANPRIINADNQREALQRIIDDQDLKLANLADSILEAGLNPMDRLLVMKSTTNGRYIVLEGNRRLAALRLLRNPSVLTDLEIRPSLRTRFEILAEDFDPKAVEPVACFEVADRAEGTLWINQRHTGENEGRGIVNWEGVATARFKGTDPALQALDFVLKYGGLTDEQRATIQARFPITTLDRILSTPGARSQIGFDVRAGKLLTALPLEEAIKPLMRIVLDLAEKRINVTKLKLKEQLAEYASKIKGVDAPDLSRATSRPRAIEDLAKHEPPSASAPTPSPRKPRTLKPLERRTLVPKSDRLNITNEKIAQIYGELRSLQLTDHPHAISVLLRVFLETSVDHYLDKHEILLSLPSGDGQKPADKKLNKKVEDAVNHMVSQGSKRKDFDGVIRALSVDHSPLYIHLLHAYIHNRFVLPISRDLAAAWDNAQPFFQRIWP
jgi:hypothetical protein